MNWITIWKWLCIDWESFSFPDNYYNPFDISLIFKREEVLSSECIFWLDELKDEIKNMPIRIETAYEEAIRCKK